MARLAKTSHDQGKHEQAEALFREVFSRRPESWSDDDWDKILADFADTLAKQGKDEQPRVSVVKDFIQKRRNPILRR